MTSNKDKDPLLSLIEEGRTGANHGLPMGMPKLESVINGVTKGTYYLLFSGSGTGKFCRLYK